MPPCLSRNHTFTLKLIIISQMNAAVGWTEAQSLDKNQCECLILTHTCNTTQFHEGSTDCYGSHDYWTAEQIQQQQKRLSKKPPKLNPVHVDDEVKTTKVMNPVSNVKADLGTITKNTVISQSSSKQHVFLCLNSMKPFFRESKANGKLPHIDQSHRRSKDNLSKSVSSPTKKHKVLKEKNDHQCTLGAFCKHSA